MVSRSAEGTWADGGGLRPAWTSWVPSRRAWAARRWGPPGVWVTAVGITLAVPAIFWIFQAPFRDFEAYLTVGSLHLLGAVKGLPLTVGPNILVVPAHHAAFWAQIQPACSSLPSVLAVVGLSAAISRRTVRSWRLLATAIVAALLVVGNVIRMASSIAVGLWAGQVSLVLFHNWVGSIFGFLYTIVGFSLLLWLLLRRQPRAPVAIGTT